ncbi:MAG: RNA methyltransferase [Ardenticatenia bacterium]|nr:RNA methyltransferase [Ardenticatenia bacterium]
MFEELVHAGLVRPEDRPFWDLLTPRRGRRMVEVLRQRTRHIALILEAVDDGHNQAAVLRSADAFGVQYVGVVRGRAPFRPNPEVTQGADKWLSVSHFESVGQAIRAMQARGYRVWASQLDETALPLPEVDLSVPAVFLFGNEHDGLSEEALRMADGRFIVPMCGFVQSLNVSVAAAITLFHATRRARREVGKAYFLTPAEQRQVLRHWLRTTTPKAVRLSRALAAPEHEAGTLPPAGPRT